MPVPRAFRIDIYDILHCWPLVISYKEVHWQRGYIRAVAYVLESWCGYC